MQHSRCLTVYSMYCIQHYATIALMPENNCAVGRNASHTSLLPSVQKLWQFAQHTDARCRHYCWTATPPVWKFLLSDINALSKIEVLFVQQGLKVKVGKNAGLSLVLF